MTTAEREKIEDRSRVMEREKKEQIVERRKLQENGVITNGKLD